MITISDLRKASEDPKCWFRIEGDEVFARNSEKSYGNLEKFLINMRSIFHCNFESIYSDATLMNILRCKDCGTVIFTNSDAYDDPEPVCPTCSNSKIQYEYWTAEDIKKDVKKANTIEMFKTEMKERNEDYEREKRTGLQFWQLMKKEKFSKDKKILKRYILERNGRKGIKGLKFIIEIYELHEDGFSYIYKKKIFIPLSFSALKLKIRLKKRMKKQEKEESEDSSL